MESGTAENVTPDPTRESVLITNHLREVREKAPFVLPGLITFHSQRLCFE